MSGGRDILYSYVATENDHTVRAAQIAKKAGGSGQEDNENHRLNHCIKYRDINLYDHPEKVAFESIYSMIILSCNIRIQYISAP